MAIGRQCTGAVILVLSLFVFAHGGSAQVIAALPVSPDELNVPTVTFQTAAHAAVAWHPSLKQAEGTLGARRENVAIARAGYYPQISGGLQSGYDNRVGSSWRPRPTLSADQMLFDFGKVSSAVEQARAGTREGRAQLLLAVDDLVRDTAYAVIEVQRAAALRQVALDQLASVSGISRLVDDRYQSGAATRSDALQARARVEDAHATLTQIEATRRRWSSTLGLLMGRDVPVDQVVSGEPAWLANACAFPADQAMGIPAVLVAEARRDEAKAELHHNRAEELPTISVGGDASTDIASPTSARSTYTVGLRVTSDIFSGGAARARSRGAEYALGAAEAAITTARLDARQGLAEAAAQVPSLRRLLDTLATRSNDMAETGKLYRLQYLQMGTRTLVDLLNAEQELNQVGFDAVNTAHDLRRLEVDCLYNTGRLRDVFGLDGVSLAGVSL